MDGDCRDGGCGSKDAGSEDYENLPTSASVSTHMTAGAMAGILEHSIMYPVDSVKVRHAEDCGGKKPGEQLQQRARLHPAQLQPRAEPRSHAAGSPGRGDRPGLSPGFGACSRGSGKAHHVAPSVMSRGSAHKSRQGALYFCPRCDPRGQVVSTQCADLAVALSDRAGAARAPLLRELVAR